MEEVNKDKTHADLIELAELERAVSVDGRSDIFTVVAILNRLELSDRAYVS